ncbi:MAG: cytochrome c [Pyrinomonadaceae bacterium]
MVVMTFAAIAMIGCFGKKYSGVVIADSKSYEASIFRQNCAICHGTEGSGRSLGDGTVVPSLRQGEFKAVTIDQIYRQIANGGNGMLSFRDQLTDRELQLMSRFVHDELRNGH